MCGAGLKLAPPSAFAARCDGDFELIRGSAAHGCRRLTVEPLRSRRSPRQSEVQFSPETLLGPSVAGRCSKSDCRVRAACEELHPLIEFAWRTADRRGCGITRDWISGNR